MEGCWFNILSHGGDVKPQNRKVVLRTRQGIYLHYINHFSHALAKKYLFDRNMSDYMEPKQRNGRWTTPFMVQSSKEFFSLCHRNNTKVVDIGPVYLGKNRKKEQRNNNLIKRKELVFDVDINDYDEERFCKCHGLKKVCDVCWTRFLTPALIELTRMLKDVFKFKGILTVFSGRRGFHVWVFDNKVMSYSDDQRTMIYNTIHGDIVKLDKSVTCSSTHLVKLPLSTHPSTHKLSIPIDETFLPSLYPEKPDVDAYIKIINEKIKDGRTDV